METNKIIEGNKIIAEFMGWTIEPGMENEEYKYYNNGIQMFLLNDMLYDTSWDWLMPVIEKIYNSELWHDFYLYPGKFLMYNPKIKIITGNHVIEDEGTEGQFIYKYIRCDADKAAWLAVVEYIKWHNSNKA